MEINILNPKNRLANKKDRPIVVKILKEAFKNDPHLNFLLEKSNAPDKIETTINYVVDETFGKGSIHLTNNDSGVALWQFSDKEEFTFEYVKRNLSFLFKLGLATVIRNLKYSKISHRYFPKSKRYCYLYLIGVLPQEQGKGVASVLMNPMLEYCKNMHIPVFLETGNSRNVEIYLKKGFSLTATYQNEKTTIHFMTIENKV